MDIEKGWLEVILKRNSKEKSISRVISAEYKPINSKGENYASEILRVKMRVVLGSGKIVNRSVLVKRIAADESQKELTEHYSLFPIETEMFSRILPEMKNIMDIKGDKRETIWCECYGHSKNLLVLEDLEESGFRLADRHKGLDLNQMKFALKAMGRFHAMSYILHANGELGAEKFGDYMMALKDNVMTNFVKRSMVTLIDVMETTWGKEWIQTIESLKILQETLPTKVNNLIPKKEDDFNVLNHGDLWTNNMLFKYDLHSNLPVEVKFIDFQTPHYNSFAWDLIYLLYSSIVPRTRDDHIEELLTWYTESARRTLEEMGNGNEKTHVPTVEKAKSAIASLSPFALLVTLSVLPIALAPPGTSFNMTNLNDKQLQHDPNLNKELFTHQSFTSTIKYELERFASNGTL